MTQICSITLILKPLRIAWLVLALFLFGCRTAPAPESKPECEVDVYVLPLDDFSYSMADQLAKQLSRDLNIKVKATLNVGTRELTPFPGTQQYSEEAIYACTLNVMQNLPKKLDTSYVVLTRRDINSNQRSLRFHFSFFNRSTRAAVVSSARMEYENGKMATSNLLWSRLYKMTKRSIGDIYFGYTRTTDIKDVMYSPIMSLDDLDKMGTAFRNVK